MRTIIFIVLAFLCMPLAQAKQCTMGALTDSKMRLAYVYKGQAATSFQVYCDSSYGIRFGSLNLQDTAGNSYVSNGVHKLRTRMSVSGAGSNMWNVVLSQSAGLNNKYIILVQLEERPTALTPAGRYTDKVYVDLIF